jgi:antitoxin YefM
VRNDRAWRSLLMPARETSRRVPRLLGHLTRPEPPHRRLPEPAAISAFAAQHGPTYNFLYKEVLTVKTMTYSESRARYAEVLDSVTDDREEVVITRAGHDPVVIVSLEDYESLKETAYLLRSPANARRLLASIDELENGGGTARELATDE